MDTVGSVGLEIKVLRDQLIRDVKSSVSEAAAEGQKQADSIGNNFKGTLRKVAAGLSVAALVKFGKDCTEVGSNLSEVQNVVDVVYGDMSDKVNDFAKSSKSAFGLSETAAKKYMGTFGSMSKAFGYSVDEAYSQSEALTGLAGDMASFYNKSTDETFNALKSVYSGEAEVLKQYGIIMNETTLNEFAMSQGIGKTVKQMSEQEKVGLRLAFVQSQLSDATGDFSRTSGSWANQIRLLTLNFEQFKATIGQALINVLTPVVQWLNNMFEYILKIAEGIKYVTELLSGIDGTSGTGGVAQDMSSAATSSQDLSKGLKSAGGAAKTLKRTLASFDKLNILQKPTSGGGGGGGIASGLTSTTGSFKAPDIKGNVQGQISEAKEAIDEFIDFCGFTFSGEGIKANALTLMTLMTVGAIRTVTTIKEVFGSGFEAIGKGFFDLCEDIGRGIFTLGEILGDGFEVIGSGFFDLCEDIGKGFFDLCDSIDGGFNVVANDLVSSVQGAIDASNNSLDTGLQIADGLLDQSQEKNRERVNETGSMLDWLEDKVFGVSADISTSIEESFAGGARAGIKGLESLETSSVHTTRILDDEYYKMKKSAEASSSAAAKSITASFNATYTQLPIDANAASVGMMNEMKRGVSEKKDTVVREVSSIGDNIKSGFSSGGKDSRYNDFVKSGNNIVEGISKGINDKKTELGKQMRKLADDAIKEFNKEAKIKSPSRVFAVSGSFLVEGLNKGIEDSADSTKKVVKDWYSEIANMKIPQAEMPMNIKDANTPQLAFVGGGNYRNGNGGTSGVSDAVVAGMTRLLPQLMAMMNSSVRTAGGTQRTQESSHIHLYLDGQEMHDVVFDYENRNNSRSGGRA